MFTAEVIYLGELRTEALHVRSGEKIITDAPIDNQGKGEAFSPTDLVSSALCSCMITLMGISINGHNMNVGRIVANVEKVMASNPRRIGEIKINFSISGELSEKQQVILEHAARTCPVSLSLHPDLIQTIHFTFN